MAAAGQGLPAAAEEARAAVDHLAGVAGQGLPAVAAAGHLVLAGVAGR